MVRLAGIAICIAFFAAFSPLTGRLASADAGSIVHIVQPGESLIQIARQYGVNPYTLAHYNGIVNMNLIHTDHLLRVPPPDGLLPVPAMAEPEPSFMPDAVAPAQNELRSDRGSARIGLPVLSPGWIPWLASDVSVPVALPTSVPATPTPAPEVQSGAPPTPTPLCEHSYTVRSGDSLLGIAARFGVNLTAIKQRNCLRSDVIVVGQRLVIPTFCS